MTLAYSTASHLARDLRVPLTASDADNETPIRVSQLLREGLAALLIVFAITGPESVTFGISKEARQLVVMQGFIGMLIGMFVAKTTGGRLFLALAYTTFYEYQYFQPPIVYLVPLPPSAALVLLALVMNVFRTTPRRLHTSSAEGVRMAVIVLSGALFFAVLISANFSPSGLEAALPPMLERWGPVFLFAAVGAMAMRRGEAAIFVDLVPFLAAVNCVTIWIYHLTGERVLYYEDIFAFHEAMARFGGMLRNPNNSAFLCGASVVILLSRLHRYPWLLKIVALANALFLTGTIALVRTRGPIVMLAFFLPLLMLRRKSRAAALIFPACAVVGYVTAGGLLQATQSEKSQDTGISERFVTSTESAYVRWTALLDALHVAVQNPFGVGDFGGAISEQSQSGIKLEAHNEYVGILARNGFQTATALVLLAAAVLACWWTAIARRFPYRPDAALTLLLLCFLFGFNVEPIFGNSHELSRCFGAVVGMFVASVLFANPQTQTPAAAYAPAAPRRSGPASPPPPGRLSPS